MRYRRLVAGDEEQAIAIVSKLKTHQPSLNYMSTFLTNPANVLIVAGQEGIPIGFVLGYKLMRCDGDDPMMLLYEIEVCAHNRRAGAGRSLVEALQDHCRDESISKMWVLTNDANTAAVRLYQSTGGARAERGAALFEYHFGC